MSVPSKTNWSALSAEERRKLPLHCGNWRAAILSTAPADRGTGEEGIADAYRAAGLTAPNSVVWSQSPFEMERDRKAVRGRVRGPALKPLIVDEVLTNSFKAIGANVPYDVRDTVERAAALPANTTRAVASIAEFVDQAALRYAWNWSAWARSVVRRDRLTPFRHSRWLPIESAPILASTSFFSQLGLESVEQSSGLHKIAISSGGFLPHRDMCWMCERPAVLSLDPTGRLHSDRGPALRYRDGTSFYAWKGVRVPRHCIENRQSITQLDVDRESDPILRRCMIDIMTPEKYIASGGATRVATDKAGVLWRRTWHGWDIWTAVEVVNGTAEPDGSFKHYFLQVPAEVHSPLEAVAWTYGMSPMRYAALEQRT